MTINIEKMRAEMRWDTRKFVLQAIAATGAAMAGGAGLFALVLHAIGKI